MQIILTNDDGIDAPGLEALQRAASQAPQSLGVLKLATVAPSGPMSCCGHQISISGPFLVEGLAPDRISVAGSPADCVRVALTRFPKVDFVLSGINPGANLGVELYNSGTAAAAREAAIHGVPAAAISVLMEPPTPVNWPLVSRCAAKILQQLLTQPLAKGSFWNINLPHLTEANADPGMVFCQPSKDPLELRFEVSGNHYTYSGSYRQRPQAPGTDVDICFSGKIAVSLVSV